MFSFITVSAWGWIAGTALQLEQPRLWSVGVYVGLCAGALALLWLGAWHRVWLHPRLRWWWRVAVWWLWAAMCAFGQTGWRALDMQAHALAPALEGRSLQLVGVVAQMPQRMEDSARFAFEVESAHDVDGQPVQLPPRVLLGWYGRRLHPDNAAPRAVPADVYAGERWRLSVRLKAPHGHINPHGFDYELWLWEQGVQATGYVRQGAQDPPAQRLGSTAAHPVEGLRQATRQAIDAQLSDRATAGIVAALLVGEQSAIARADWDVFRATGVAHLMAISGLHITGLAWLAALGVGSVWRRSDAWSLIRPWALRVPTPLAAGLVGLAVAWGYAVFAGWGVPAQRTVWMLAVVTLLRSHGVRWPWPQVWLSVCALVLALDPWAWLQAGFWLSFVAVGVLFISGAPVLAQPARGVGPALRRLWHEQWLMSVCLAPLSLLLFHQVSLVGLFANLIAVPWVTLVVTPLCLLGLLLPLAWHLAAQALQLLMWLLSACAQLPWAQWSAPAAPLWAGGLALLGVGLMAMRLPPWLRWQGLVLVLPVLSWQTPRPAAGEFELMAADMGQGHAVLLRTASHSLLYDTGPRYSAETDAGQRVLVPLLRAWGERLDRIVISHQDSDHSGGAATVMAMQPQADVLSSIAQTHVLQQRQPMQRCQRGQSWVWDGVQVDVLHPQPQDYERARKPNALSCVLRVTSASGARALLVGDIEAPQELALVQSGQGLHAQWLLVPHHGSATSSTLEFLTAVQPAVAVVQAGYRNRFGHPRPEVLARYAALGVNVVQTPRCGASLWRSDQPISVQCERHQRQRYWQHRML